MAEQQEIKPDLDKWDDFAGDYLKCDIVKEFPVTLVPISIDSFMRDDKAGIVIEIEYNKRKWKLELNKTNQNFIRAKGLVPKEIIGKKLVFEKTQNKNPRTSQNVDAFLLSDVEE